MVRPGRMPAWAAYGSLFQQFLGPPPKIKRAYQPTNATGPLALAAPTIKAVFAEDASDLGLTMFMGQVRVLLATWLVTRLL
jgi:hypothetical protein